MSRRTFPIPFIIVVALLLLATTSWATPVINGTTIAGSQLTITGTRLSGTPLSVDFNGKPLTVVSSSATQIVASLAQLPAPGTYRLVVQAGKASAVAYVGISAAPNIVAQVAFLNQTGGIPLTTLVTPQSNGLFRISGTVESTNCPPYGVYFTWTDDTGPDGGYIALDAGSSIAIGNLYTLSSVVRDLAGAPLSYEVFSYNVCAPYSLFFTVEQIQ